MWLDVLSICYPSPISLLSNALVLPHFDYCSNVWTNCSKHNLTSLQMQQNKLARIILGADLYTHIDDMLNELQWSRLNKRWDIAMYCFIFKCLCNFAPTYLSSQFNYTSSIHSPGFTPILLDINVVLH